MLFVFDLLEAYSLSSAFLFYLIGRSPTSPFLLPPTTLSNHLILESFLHLRLFVRRLLEQPYWNFNSSKAVIMLVTSLSTALSAIALFTTSTNALPKPGKPTVYTPASDLSNLAKLMPTSALPVPDGQLKYVVLGIGTQNYTCTSGDPNAAPGTTGAVGKNTSQQTHT